MAPGLVDLRQAEAGHTKVTGMLGAGGFVVEAPNMSAGGGLSIEPHATRRLSIPMGAGAGWTPGWDMVVASTRVGARYRLRDHFSLGGGVNTNHWIDSDAAQLATLGPDLEVTWGTRFDRLSLSSTFRPTLLLSTEGTPDLHLHGNFALGYDLSERLTISGNLWGGYIGSWRDASFFSSGGYEDTGFLAGILGLSYSFGQRDAPQ